MYTTIRLKTLINQQVHAILEGALTLSDDNYIDLFPSRCADAWGKVLADLARGDGIKRVRRAETLVYQWAIAPQLSSHLNIPAPTIAQSLTTLLTQAPAPLKTSDPHYGLRVAMWKDCKIRIHGQHLIQMEVGDRALAIWLQQIVAPHQDMTEFSAPAPSREGSPTTLQQRLEELFLLQTAHARCCSLLRLGEREGLITIYPPLGEDLPLGIDSPRPLPWLQDEGQLRLSQPIERDLIGLGVEILGDRTVSLHQINVLCEHFYRFEAACRILGQVKIYEPQLAQARLGLIFLIRCCLAEWLKLQGARPLQEL